MVAVAIFNSFAAKLSGLQFSSIGIDGSKVTIVRPKLSGFRGDGQPNTLTADHAIQDVKQPGRVELHNLTGDIGMSPGETTHISADTGVYDTVGEHMNLADNIRIGNSRFDIKLRSAEIDFKSGVYKSADPVEIYAGPGTTIRADRAEAHNNGQELTFDGGVRTTIVPQSGEGEAREPTHDRPTIGRQRRICACAGVGGGGAHAATKEPAKEATSSSPVQILPGTGPKEPITIDADKLVYFDKEKKAIYSGNVIVVQGEPR